MRNGVVLKPVFLVVSIACSLPGLAAPPYTIEQTPQVQLVPAATWFDSMLATRTMLREDEAAGKRPKPAVSFHSDVVHGRQPARAISVPIRGVEEVYLYVTGAPDVEYGAGDWIAPTAIDAAGNETLLCSGKSLQIQQAFHTVDCSLRSRVDPPLRIADQLYDHGINLQAPGKIRVKLPKGTVRPTRFQRHSPPRTNSAVRHRPLPVPPPSGPLPGGRSRGIAGADDEWRS